MQLPVIFKKRYFHFYCCIKLTLNYCNLLGYLNFEWGNEGMIFFILPSWIQIRTEIFGIRNSECGSETLIDYPPPNTYSWRTLRTTHYALLWHAAIFLVIIIQLTSFPVLPGWPVKVEAISAELRVLPLSETNRYSIGFFLRLFCKDQSCVADSDPMESS